MKTTSVFLFLLFSFASIATTKAAVITWGTAKNILGDTDVLAVGTLVEAASLGNTGSVTLNGVTFLGYNLSGSSSGGHFLMGGNTFGGYDNGGGPAGSPITTLSSSYQNLLAHGDYTSGNSAMSLFISGLVTGTNYSFQWWASDSRNSFPGTETATAGNVSTLNHNVGDIAGGIGQYAIGSFNADAATQSIIFQGDTSIATQQNAFQLRLAAAPEPGRSTLLLMSSAALFLRRRRK